MDWNQARRLYVAEIPNGVIKVGISRMASDARVRTLGFKGKTMLPTRYQFFDKHECGFWAERELIERMERIACPAWGREWFTGIRFGAAVNLAAQITRRALAIDAERKAA